MHFIALLLLAFLGFTKSMSAYAWTTPASNKCSRYSTEDQCMICACYHEAEGEIFEGKVAVVQTILTRKGHKLYPKTACTVVYQPSQYSWSKHPKIMSNKKALADCTAATNEAKSRGANGFISFNNGPKPGGKEIKYCTTIGKHKFYARSNANCPSRGTASSKPKAAPAAKSSK